MSHQFPQCLMSAAGRTNVINKTLNGFFEPFDVCIISWVFWFDLRQSGLQCGSTQTFASVFSYCQGRTRVTQYNMYACINKCSDGNMDTSRLLGNYDRLTDRPTDYRGHKEVSLPKREYNKYLYFDGWYLELVATHYL